jgi:hypothetical protein
MAGAKYKMRINLYSTTSFYAQAEKEEETKLDYDVYV